MATPKKFGRPKKVQEVNAIFSTRDRDGKSFGSIRLRASPRCAADHRPGAAQAGERYLNTTFSQFFLIALCVIWTYFGQAAFELDASLSLGAGASVTLRSTRASVPAANVADTTGASSTQSCRHWLPRRADR
jgi:hypothetical protein